MMSNFPRLALQLRVQMPIREPVQAHRKSFVALHASPPQNLQQNACARAGAPIHTAGRSQVVHALFVPHELLRRLWDRMSVSLQFWFIDTLGLGVTVRCAMLWTF